MLTNTCVFTNVTEMASFCAELTRCGIAFHTFDRGGSYVVEITGY